MDGSMLGGTSPLSQQHIYQYVTLSPRIDGCADPYVLGRKSIIACQLSLAGLPLCPIGSRKSVSYCSFPVSVAVKSQWDYPTSHVEPDARTVCHRVSRFWCLNLRESTRRRTRRVHCGFWLASEYRYVDGAVSIHLPWTTFQLTYCNGHGDARSTHKVLPCM
jgi:hypothetical protein